MHYHGLHPLLIAGLHAPLLLALLIAALIATGITLVRARARG